jgi:DNA-binding MarR family transcriptional regulator
MNAPATGSAALNLEEIDRLIHEPARLSVMALLYVVDCADFKFVMNQVSLTWGNLSAHLRKLEEAGYVKIEKSFKGKRPNTELRLTAAGREAFQDYRAYLQGYLDGLPE